MVTPIIVEATPHWYRELRHRFGFSLQQVSLLTGAQFGTLKAWEFDSMAVSPSVLQLARLAAMYGVHWNVVGDKAATEAMHFLRFNQVPRGEFFETFAQLLAVGRTREEAMAEAVRQVQGRRSGE